jgi:hypothetical protein
LIPVGIFEVSFRSDARGNLHTNCQLCSAGAAQTAYRICAMNL